MLAAYGPSPGRRPGDRDAEAHDALDGLLVVHRVAPLADDREVVEQRVDGGERAAGQGRQHDPIEPPPHLALVDERERGLARRGDARREPPPDLRGQPDRLLPVVAGEVRHLDPVEDRELDGLLGAGRELVAGLVELLDEVDRRQVGAAELGQLATQREPRPDAPDQPGFGERGADVRDRRLRQSEPAGQLARSQPGRCRSRRGGRGSPLRG